MRALATRPYWWALGITLLVALVARMYVAAALPNLIWPDEIFQTLEQGHRAAFGHGVVPWEFRDGLRSWVFPGFLAAVMACTSWVTSSVGAYLMACAAALSLISLLPVWAAFKEAASQIGLKGAIVAGAFVALWFELVFFAPKALSEVVAGNCLALGVVAGGACMRAAASPEAPPRRRSIVVFAAMVALAPMLRIHLAIAAFAVFVIVFLRLARRDRWTCVAVAGGVVVLAGLVDAVTWGAPFHSYIENVRVNVLLDKSSHYGTAPWYAYFEVYARVWGPWGLGILALAVVGARRAPLLAICALLVVLSHVPIAHKEYRFAYPAMLLVIMLAGHGAAYLVHALEARTSSRTGTLVVVAGIVAWFAASAVGASAFHASKTQLANVWHEEQDHWIRRRGGLLGMRQLGEDRDVCGVGLAGVGWGDTGGYTYLHRDIPLFPFPNQELLWHHLPHFNGLLMQPGKPERIGPFVQQTCWEDACIYRRPGGCEPLPGWDVNAVLELAKQ